MLRNHAWRISEATKNIPKNFTFIFSCYLRSKYEDRQRWKVLDPTTPLPWQNKEQTQNTNRILLTPRGNISPREMEMGSIGDYLCLYGIWIYGV
jgi:hypothetical protein